MPIDQGDHASKEGYAETQVEWIPVPCFTNVPKAFVVLTIVAKLRLVELTRRARSLTFHVESMGKINNFGSCEGILIGIETRRSAARTQASL
jgi:hypothetical protein